MESTRFNERKRKAFLGRHATGVIKNEYYIQQYAIYLHFTLLYSSFEKKYEMCREFFL